MRLDQLKVWREQVGRALLSVDFRPVGDAPFRHSLEPILNKDGVRIARWRHSPGFTFRDESLARDGESSFSLIIAHAGSLRCEHRGRAFTLRSGQATLLHNGEPGTLGSCDESRYLAILLPSSPVLESGKVQDLIGRSWPKQTSALRLLRAYVDAYGSAVRTSTAALESTVARHVTELANLALSDASAVTHEVALAAHDAPRLAIAFDFIARNAFNPALSVADVARQQGISARYLQQLFERAGVRPKAHINSVRLETAKSLLLDPQGRDKRISDIALACGFSDVSHFNRLFRRAFGVTPTAMRQGPEAR